MPASTTLIKECSRCRKREGDTDPEGREVFFTKNRKQCYRCSKRNKTERGPDARMQEVRRTFPVAVNIGVYCIKLGSEIVYIGSSDRLPWRLYQHFQCNKSFDDGLGKMQRSLVYSWHIMWHGDSVEDAIHNEKVLIQLHNPKYNKIKYKNYAT